MLRCAQYRRISAISSSSPGSSTASGASWTPGSLRRSRSSVDLPPARNSRSRSSTTQCAAPTIAASASRSVADSADGRNLHLLELEFGGRRVLDAEGLFQQGADPVGQRLGGLRVAPRVPLHRGQKRGLLLIRTSHALQYYRCCQSVTTTSPDIGDRILDAAASCVAAYGVDRVTLAEIARRARVSRPTVYRRWPDTRSILAALLTARITDVLHEVPSRGVGREPLVAADRRRGRTHPARRRDHRRCCTRPPNWRWSTSPNAWAPASRSSSTPSPRSSRRHRTRAACAPAIRASSPRCAC